MTNKVALQQRTTIYDYNIISEVNSQFNDKKSIMSPKIKLADQKLFKQ